MCKYFYDVKEYYSGAMRESRANCECTLESDG